MIPIKISKKDLKRHILFWAIIILHFWLFDPMKGTLYVQIISGTSIDLSYIILYYFISLFIFPRFWPCLINLVLGLSASFLIYCFIDYLIFFKLFKLIESPDNSYDNIGQLLFSSFFSYLIIAFCASSFFFNKLANYKIKLNNEKEKVLYAHEFNFFKIQLSEKYIFKFLEYYKTKIQHISSSSVKATDLFSEILKYNLNADPDRCVQLGSEIKHITNFIELQKNLHDKGYVEFKISGNIEDCLIAPRILITFVENAFKHGIYNDKNNPIYIELNVAGSVIFYVKNKKKPGNKLPGSGTGLKNVKQALDMFYEGKYELNVVQNQDYYISNLTIEL